VRRHTVSTFIENLQLLEAKEQENYLMKKETPENATFQKPSIAYAALTAKQARRGQYSEQQIAGAPIAIPSKRSSKSRQVD
jgi:hypothetical protein